MTRFLIATALIFLVISFPWLVEQWLPDLGITIAVLLYGLAIAIIYLVVFVIL